MRRTTGKLPRAWLLGLALVGLTVIAYAPALRCGFVNYDDPLYVSSNPHVRAGLSTAGLRWALGTFHASNWHPLTWLSLQLDATLFGVQPWGFHLTNLIVHLASTLVLFAVLCRITSAPWAGALVAALFAVHPLHVESVVWVAERKDVLSGLFWMLTLLTYAWFVRRQSGARYALLLFVFALGLLAKPMLVTLPFVLLLLDYWPLERRESPRRLFLEKLPLLCLALASCAVTVYAQSRDGAVESFESYGPADRLANAVLSYGRYLKEVFWFFHLAPFYVYPTRAELTGPALASGLLLLGITGVSVGLRKSHPHLLVGWLWYLGTLVPVIGLVQVGWQAMADRYTYLPLIGIFLMVAWEIRHWAARRPTARYLSIACASSVLLVCALSARGQVRYWVDSKRLWEHTLAATGPNPVAHLNLGQVFAREGKHDEALYHYREAVRLSPRYYLAHVNLAQALVRSGQRREAREHIEEALHLNPNNALTQNAAAEVLDECGESEKALHHLRLALEFDPHCGPAHNNLGAQMERLGRPEEAVLHYRRAIAFDPTEPAPLINLGTLYHQHGRLEEAERCYRDALRLEPDSEPAHVNLGILLLRKQRIAEASSHFQSALAINPESAKAHCQLGLALQATGRLEEALAHLRRALQLDPRSEQYRRAATFVLRKLDRAGEAAVLEGDAPHRGVGPEMAR